MRSVPWLGMPMMSPATASSAISRSWARNMTGALTFTALVDPTGSRRMPRLKWPEHSRTKAMRTRCFRSIFAWILNTKPDNGFSVGTTSRETVSRACGAGAHSTNESSSGRMPKLLTAEPKKTGVTSPAR